MTREQIAEILERCVTEEEEGCVGCPLIEDSECNRTIQKEMLRLIHEKSAVQEAPGLVGEILGHFKKPLVNISFQEMEETEGKE